MEGGSGNLNQAPQGPQALCVSVWGGVDGEGQE